MTESYYIGVDVGTGSVRAALVDREGNIHNVSTKPIQTWNPKKDFYEQSSNDIWKACCDTVRNVIVSIDPGLVKGISFDATCSLVVIGQDDGPLPVSPGGTKEKNVILWMDHRAKEQADFINKSKNYVLNYLGGKISLEMQTPKLMWLKENMKDTWKKVKYFFDLCDFLTWKATGDDSRSLCSVVCKWTYINGPIDGKGWVKDYFTLTQLEDLLEKDSIKIGKHVKTPGDPCGNGLNHKSGNELGLLPGTAVGTGIIDAHAGGLGIFGSTAAGTSPEFETRIGMICGTSTCHMTVNKDPIFVSGIWGPYYSAMIPNLWLNEAGQSATGKVVDYIVCNHPAAASIMKKLEKDTHIHDYLNDLLIRITATRELKSMATLTNKLHIWPDFHGNRSPIADSTLRGMITGLSISVDEEDLAVLYLATLQALAYGTRHILEKLVEGGHDRISSVLMCGGLSKNELFVQCHADILGIPVLLPDAAEPVLLGTAMLAAVAAKRYKNLEEAITSMSGDSKIYEPNNLDQKYHAMKYKVFLKMLSHQKEYDSIMDAAN